MSSITGVVTQKKIQKVTFWRDGYKIQTQSNNQAKKGKKGTKPERTKTVTRQTDHESPELDKCR